MQDLLFLAHRIPYPPDKGDKIRSWNILKFLAQRYRVHLGCFVDNDYDWRHRETLERWCETCFCAPVSQFGGKLRSAAGLVSGQPLTLAHYRHPALQQWVNEVIRDTGLRRVFVFSAAMAQYVMPGRPDGIRRILDFVDVDSEKWRQYSDAKPWPVSFIYSREGRTLLRFEIEAARRFDSSLFVSAAEAELFRQLAPSVAKKVDYLSNGVDLTYFSPEETFDNPYPPDETALVFTGAMDYWPNVDAVEWFARHMLHRVRERVRDLRFYVVGANPAPDIRSLERIAGVTVTGRVPDVRPYLAHAAAVVAPMRIARGVQNKVLEAMAMAKPVIATPPAIEGLDVTAGQDLLVGSDEDAFVSETVALLTGSGADGLARRARACVVRNYEWSGHLAKLERIIDGPAAIRGDDGFAAETAAPVMI